MKAIRFAENLREILDKRKISITKLADMTYISEQSIGRYRKGGEPTLTMVCAIADALNVSLDDLVFSEGGRWSE